jgi:hypothetical protein
MISILKKDQEVKLKITAHLARTFIPSPQTIFAWLLNLMKSTGVSLRTLKIYFVSNRITKNFIYSQFLFLSPFEVLIYPPPTQFEKRHRKKNSRSEKKNQTSTSSIFSAFTCIKFYPEMISFRLTPTHFLSPPSSYIQPILLMCQIDIVILKMLLMFLLCAFHSSGDERET